MKVADLISPVDYEGDDQIVRFVWDDDAWDAASSVGRIVVVLTKGGRQHLPQDEARKRWRDLRKAGWTKGKTAMTVIESASRLTSGFFVKPNALELSDETDK